MNELDLVSISQMIEYFKRHKEMLASVNLVGLCSVNYAIKLLEEKQERDIMCCGNCKNYLGEDDDGMCLREDLFELPTVKPSDYCSYFEKREV